MTSAADSAAIKGLRVGGVLVVSEGAADAVLIKTLLKEDFDNVVVKISAAGELATAEFLELQPKVLLLAFREIEKAEQCYLGLYRSGGAGALQAHRTVLLCTKEAVNQAFELCRRGLFDDYVLFWPMAYDAARLRMTVHRGLAELASSPGSLPAAMTIAAQVARIAELEALLGQPRSPAVGQAAHATPAPPTSIRPSILVVDDDEFQHKLLALMLEPEGFAVHFAASGSEALRKLSVAPVSIILMDFNLPDMNGIEVIKRLKDEPLLAAIPVIMITGSSERDIVLNSRRNGAVDFVVKPVERSILLDKLRRIGSGAEAGVAYA
jgi:CheY-like chemotaxis protein